MAHPFEPWLRTLLITATALLCVSITALLVTKTMVQGGSSPRDPLSAVLHPGLPRRDALTPLGKKVRLAGEAGLCGGILLVAVFFIAHL